MQKARRHPDKSGLRPFVSARFQVLFHSSVRGAFHLSLTVLVHYRSLRSIQPQRMVPLDSDRISPVPPYSGYWLGIKRISPTGLSPSMVWLSSHALLHVLSPYHQSYNPQDAVTSWVWAVSRSLATTWEITLVFFSSAYLDVSVQRVRLRIKRIS